MTTDFRNISARQLHTWLNTDPESVFLLDVRQPGEFDLARIEGSTLIPLGTLHAALDEVPQDRRVVAICHHGVRSAMACQILAQRGQGRLYNLAGGIDAWSIEVDAGVPRY